MRFRVIVIAWVTALLFPVLSAAGDVVLIGNASIGVSTLSKQDIYYIFLGEKRVWENGVKVVFAIQTDKDLNKLFCKNYVGMSASQYTGYWKRKVFTGRGVLPTAFDGNQKMIKFVSETKGAIGYVSAGSNLENVKTISVK